MRQNGLHRTNDLIDPDRAVYYWVLGDILIMKGFLSGGVTGKRCCVIVDNRFDRAGPGLILE